MFRVPIGFSGDKYDADADDDDDDVDDDSANGWEVCAISMVAQVKIVRRALHRNSVEGQKQTTRTDSKRTSFWQSACQSLRSKTNKPFRLRAFGIWNERQTQADQQSNVN